ncbi:hypothetical protein BH18THE2_BH18THE2_43470 [soil metagenome]
MISLLRLDGGDHIFLVSSCKKLGLARRHEEQQFKVPQKILLNG